MHHRRPTAIAGLLLALVPATLTLSSCGFHYPTDRVNTIAAGENNRDASVDALGIRVLASAPGEGRLIGSLSNNLKKTASLVSVTAPGGEASSEFKPVEVEGRDRVNLSNDVVIPLTGSFTAGDVVTLELGFSTGESVSLNVPVVKNCFQYTQIPTPTPSEEAEADESDVVTPTDAEAAGEAADDEGAAAVEESDTVEATEQESEDAEGEEHAEEGGDARFNCADEAPEPEGGEH